MTKKFILEIATTDFQSTKNAVAGGADRIELCANLSEGGTTQSYGVIKKSRDVFDVKIYPIIRVRGGDFFYTDDEYDCMYNDSLKCKELNCDGIVIGFLNKNATIDVDRTARLVEAVYPMRVTFHRAFDRCLDPYQAMEQLIEIGCERILTSGQKLTAPEGVELIAELNKLAGDRIIIMPGSGVKPSNIVQLAQQTGCSEFHASLRELKQTNMDYFPKAFDNNPENNYFSINPDVVKETKNALHSTSSF